jgi:hypothetical protein
MVQKLKFISQEILEKQYECGLCLCLIYTIEQ